MNQNNKKSIIGMIVWAIIFILTITRIIFISYGISAWNSVDAITYPPLVFFFLAPLAIVSFMMFFSCLSKYKKSKASNQ